MEVPRAKLKAVHLWVDPLAFLQMAVPVILAEASCGFLLIADTTHRPLNPVKCSLGRTQASP